MGKPHLENTQQKEKENNTLQQSPAPAAHNLEALSFPSVPGREAFLGGETGSNPQNQQTTPERKRVLTAEQIIARMSAAYEKLLNEVQKEPYSNPRDANKLLAQKAFVMGWDDPANFYRSVIATMEAPEEQQKKVFALLRQTDDAKFGTGAGLLTEANGDFLRARHLGGIKSQNEVLGQRVEKLTDDAFKVYFVFNYAFGEELRDLDGFMSGTRGGKLAEAEIAKDLGLILNGIRDNVQKMTQEKYPEIYKAAQAFDKK